MAYSQPRWCILRQHAMDPWSIVFYVSHWNLIQYSHHDISLYIISTYTLVELRTLCSTDSHLPGLTMTSLKKVTANKASMTKKTKRSWRIHLTKQKGKIKPTNILDFVKTWRMLWSNLWCLTYAFHNKYHAKRKGTSKGYLKSSSSFLPLE